MSFDKLKMTFITFWGLLIQPPCIIGAANQEYLMRIKNPTILARNCKFRAAGFDKTAIKLT